MVSQQTRWNIREITNQNGFQAQNSTSDHHRTRHRPVAFPQLAAVAAIVGVEQARTVRVPQVTWT